MHKELTPEEQQEFDTYGELRCTIDEFCERRKISKTDLGRFLGVTRIQVNNYKNQNRMIEWNPESDEIEVIAREQSVNTGVLGVVREPKKRSSK